MIKMNSQLHHPVIRDLLISLVVCVISASCSLASINSQQSSIETVVETKVVTVNIPVKITQEVTSLLYVPVTLTPTRTPQFTFTPSYPSTDTNTPTTSPTPAPPQIKVLQYTDCLYGPGRMYLYKTSLLADQQMEVIGRNPDGDWIEIQAVGGWNPCWIEADRAGGLNALNDLSVVYPKLPFSNLYLTPDAIARRNGNDVIISWQATWRSFDDYRGYLLETWLCSAGKQVFAPIGYTPSLADNTGILSVKVIDEPGCPQPSRVVIYSVDKHGYSAPGKIPWPAQ
jgi:hypothetical protein